MKGLFKCPCCCLPTLKEQACWNICTVCWWEDDGQNDPHADELSGGPNGEYSLSQARKNAFRRGHMYDAGEGIDVVEQPSLERLHLLEVALPVIRGEQKLNHAEFAIRLALVNTDYEDDDEDV